jgi:DNA polymerase elongation subunit (family B)
MEILTLSAYDWKVRDGSTDTGQVAIHAWCLDRDSKPYLIRINDFPAFCYVELPSTLGYRKVSWNRGEELSIVKDWLQSKSGGILNLSLMYKSRLYYNRDIPYSNNESRGSHPKLYPMLAISFKTLKAMGNLERNLANPVKIPGIGVVNFRVWETSIPLERKLLSQVKCGYSQWFNVQGTPVEPGERISTLDREYIINWTTISPIDDLTSSGWVTRPGILSFDIECCPDNPKSFPNQYLIKDVAYMISVLYQRSGDKNSLKRHVIIMSPCGDISGVEVSRVTTETELCNEFSRLVRLYDPEIITGYNILGFDYPYLDARIKNTIGGMWQEMGRIKGKKPTIKTLSWSSSAYGFQNLIILEMDGRISVDMLPLIRREYRLSKYDLGTVSHEFLGRGKHDIKPIEMFRIFKHLQRLPDDLDGIQQMTRVAHYCVEDAELALDLFEVLNTWISLVELSNIVGVTIMDLFTRGQQIRCLSQIYDLASQLEIVLDKRVSSDESFSGGFVFEPQPGIFDNVICLDFKSLYPSIIMAYNICYTTLVPPELESSIPDEICNIIECVEDENSDQPEYETEAVENQPSYFSINIRKDPMEIEGERDEEEGNEEMEIDQKKPVRTFRYKFIKAEYKKGVIPQLAEKLVSRRTEVRNQAKRETDLLRLTVLDKRQNALKVSANSIFGFLGVRGGKLALMEGARSITSKGRELITFCNRYLETEHQARIIYNDTDSTMFVLPTSKVSNEKETLEWGKKLELEISSKFPKPLYTEFEKGGRVFTMKKKKYAFWSIDPETKRLKVSEKYFVRESKSIQPIKISTIWTPADLKIPFQQLPTGIKFDEKEYLKVLNREEVRVKGKSGESKSPSEWPIKKMADIWKSPSELQRIKRTETVDIWDPRRGFLIIYKVVSPSFLARGITIARRDNCAWQRNVYNQVLDEILERTPMEKTFDIIEESCLDLRQRKIPLSDLTIVRGLGANYKSQTYFMKIFGDELVRIGRPANPGDRLEYLIVKSRNIEQRNIYNKDGVELLGYKMRLYDYYLEQMEAGTAEPVDFDYYLNNVIKNSVEQLFQLGYSEKIEEYRTKFIRMDYERLFADLCRQGYQEVVEHCWNRTNGNFEKMLELLMETRLKTSLKKLKTYYITRWRRLSTRIDYYPIRMMDRIFEVKSEIINEINNRVPRLN